MRKIILCIILCVCASISVFAQSLDFRKIVPGGFALASEFQKVSPSLPKSSSYAYQSDLYMSVKYDKIASRDYTHTGFYLILRFYTKEEDFYTPASGQAKFRTTTGKVIDLTTVGGPQKRIIWYDPLDGSQNDISCLRGSYYDLDKKGETEYLYRITCYCPISEANLLTLISEGIVKVRLETNKNYFECSFKDSENKTMNGVPMEINVPGYVLNQLYNVVKENIDPYTKL